MLWQVALRCLSGTDTRPTWTGVSLMDEYRNATSTAPSNDNYCRLARWTSLRSFGPSYDLTRKNLVRQPAGVTTECCLSQNKSGSF